MTQTSDLFCRGTSMPVDPRGLEKMLTNFRAEIVALTPIEFFKVMELADNYCRVDSNPICELDQLRFCELGAGPLDKALNFLLRNQPIRRRIISSFFYEIQIFSGGFTRYVGIET